MGKELYADKVLSVSWLFVYSERDRPVSMGLLATAELKGPICSVRVVFVLACLTSLVVFKTDEHCQTR